MNENMQTMTENTANDFIKALEDMNQAAEEYADTMRKVMPDIADQIVLEVWKKNLYYTERYFSAWPITRWWWKRKMEKSKIALMNANQFAAGLKAEILKLNQDVVN